MDETEFEHLLHRRYAQVVLKVLLDAEGHSYAFSALREEVNSITSDDSRGATEMSQKGEYSPASLTSLLSAAKDTGLVDQYLNDDGKVRWRLCPTQLSQSQIDEIRSKNSTNKAHTDTSSHDIYQQSYTDSAFR